MVGLLCVWAAGEGDNPDSRIKSTPAASTSFPFVTHGGDTKSLAPLCNNKVIYSLA